MTTKIFGVDVPTWIVVLVGALVIGAVYTENPTIGTPLLWIAILMIVFSLVRQGKVA